MTEAPTQGYLKEVLDYFPETGAFVWKVDRRKVKPGVLAGAKSSHKNPYWEIRIDGNLWRSHQLAFLWMLGFIPKGIDHIDGCGLNNRWVNLRVADQTENMKNQKLSDVNKSGLMGVYRDRNRWMTYINVGTRRFYLGRTPDFFEACCRRKAAELLHDFHENHGRR